MMSIFPLFLLWGVASPRHISYYDDDSVLQPIMTRSQERRICAELCMTGLGGTPCGEDCVDITPQGLPLQFPGKNTSDNTNSLIGTFTRQSACPLLCENQLGYPLCNCDDDNIQKKSRVDYVQICGFYCVSYNYQIYGCQNCELYRNMSRSVVTEDDPRFFLRQFKQVFKTQVVNWDRWCQRMCEDGEGGAACNCDLLPMNYLAQ